MALDDLLTVEDGARAYVEHLRENGEASKSLTSFFIFYDPVSGTIRPWNASVGPLHKKYSNFSILKKKGNLPKNIDSFDAWIFTQIPSQLKRELQQLTEACFPQYSLEDGVAFYIKHLSRYREKSLSLGGFFRRFDPTSCKILPRRRQGKLGRFVREFHKLKKLDKLPEGTESYEDWVQSQISTQSKEKLEVAKLNLGNRAMDYMLTVEDGARLYLGYLKKHGVDSMSLGAFYRRFDGKQQGLLPKGRAGTLNKHYSRFFSLRKKGRLPENVVTFDQWVMGQIDANLANELEELLQRNPRQYSVEEGVRFYVQHMRKFGPKSFSLGAFFERFDPDINEICPRSPRTRGKLRRHYARFGELRRNGKLPKNIMTFEDWVKTKIPFNLVVELTELMQKYLREYSIPEGVKLYVSYLQEHGEKTPALTEFFTRFEPRTNTLLDKSKSGMLNRYCHKFRDLRKKGELPKGVYTFEDWLKSQISAHLIGSLEKAIKNYAEPYPLSRGVRLYIDYSKGKREHNLCLLPFFRRFDPTTKQIRSKGGKFYRYHAQYLRLRRDNLLPKGVTTFEDWVKSQIPVELAKELDELIEKYFKEYTLKQGAEFYVQHLQDYQDNSIPLKAFFSRYDPKTGKLNHWSKRGSLYRYCSKFDHLKNKKSAQTFEDWVKAQIPNRPRIKIERLRRKYLERDSLEQGVELYTQHILENKRNSLSLTCFFKGYDSRNKKRTAYGKGRFVRYHNRYAHLRDIGKLPKRIRTFQDWINSQISATLEKKLQKLTEKHLKEYTLLDGAQLYVQYLRENQWEDLSLTTFLRRYDIESENVLPERQDGDFSNHYAYFFLLKKMGEIPDHIESFEQWVKSQLPRKLVHTIEKLTRIRTERTSLESGVESYIEYLSEHEDSRPPLADFFCRFDFITQSLLPKPKRGQFAKYHNKYSWLRGSRSQDAVTFEDWVKSEIPAKLRKRLEDAFKTYFGRYSLQEGVEFYIQHLQKNKEKSLKMATFFQRFDPITKSLRPSNKVGKLNRYYSHFYYLRKDNNLPKGINSFKDWVKIQIGTELRGKLEELIQKYLERNLVLEGVKHYISYLQQHKSENLGIVNFFHRFDLQSGQILPPRHTGTFYNCYAEYQREKKRGNLPENITEFQDWVKSQIPGDVSARLDELVDKYLREYTILDGVNFYLEHLRTYKCNSVPIIAFFSRYDTEMKQLLPWNKKGKLKRHYNAYGKRKKAGKIPRDQSFYEWVENQIPEPKRRELKDLTKRYINVNLLLEGMDFYIQHLMTQKGNSLSLAGFYRRFDPVSGKILLEGKVGALYRCYQAFGNKKLRGELKDLSFRDYIIQQLPPEKREMAAYYLKGQYLKDLAKQKIDVQRLKSMIMEG